jgi:hypothetical protein
VELSIVLERNPDAAYRLYDGEGVIVQAETMMVRVVNPTGSRVWELLDGATTVGQVVQTICEEYEVAREEAEKDVLAFLDELAENGLVRPAGAP